MSLELSIDRLWAVLHAPPRVLPRAGWRRLLTHEAAELRAEVESHFVLEEEGGYLAELIEERPHLAGPAETLLAEHARIREDLASLAAAIDGGASVEAIRGRLRDVVSVLSRHESRENELVQQPTHVDLGGD
jgi:hypothetical protein